MQIIHACSNAPKDDKQDYEQDTEIPLVHLSPPSCVIAPSLFDPGPRINPFSLAQPDEKFLGGMSV
jgi:hypothetical protein